MILFFALKVLLLETHLDYKSQLLIKLATFAMEI